MRLLVGGSGVLILVSARDLILSKSSRPTLEPTQLPLKWASGFFPRGDVKNKGPATQNAGCRCGQRSLPAADGSALPFRLYSFIAWTIQPFHYSFYSNVVAEGTPSHFQNDDLHISAPLSTSVRTVSVYGP